MIRLIAADKTLIESKTSQCRRTKSRKIEIKPIDIGIQTILFGDEQNQVANDRMTRVKFETQ